LPVGSNARDPAIGHMHPQQASPSAVKRTRRGDDFFIAFCLHACFIPENFLKIKPINPCLLNQDSVLFLGAISKKGGPVEIDSIKIAAAITDSERHR
jgi:hypothetical protein